MISSCGSCMGVIDTQTSLSVTCAGICDRRYHLECVNISSGCFHYIKNTPGLSWKCTECDRKCFSIDHLGLNKFLEDKHSEMSNNLNAVFESLKADFSKIAEEKLRMSSLPATTDTPQSYSEILKNRVQPAIIVQPKNIIQTAVRTRSDIQTSINPVESQLSLSKVKNVQCGGVLVGFNNKEDNVRFKKAALQKLSADYEIREIKGIQPRIKLVGMTENYAENEITEYIEHAVKLNSTSINLNFEVKLIKCWPTKKKPNIFQSIVQVDRLTYDTVIKTGGLFVGYDYCYVFDAFEILRCFKCNDFNHSSKNCSGKKSCPKCGQDENMNHTISECKVEKFKCVNCVNLNKVEKSNTNVEHAAWDVNCVCFKNALEKLKKDMFLKQ